MIINNPQNSGELINGAAGEYHFCRECPHRNTCDHKGSKIFLCNKDIIQYAFEIEKGFKMYVWDGNWEEQPVWWFNLLQTCQSYIAKIREKNAKRTAKSKDNSRYKKR